MSQSPTWSEADAQAALQEVLRRSAEDSAFRDFCLRSPAQAVQEATGRDLPEGFRLQFVDNAGATLTVVLPDLAVTAELSDSDLEAVAGGSDKGGQCGISKVCGVSKGTDPKPSYK